VEPARRMLLHDEKPTFRRGFPTSVLVKRRLKLIVGHVGELLPIRRLVHSACGSCYGIDAAC
jgi:hypothetical protein